MNKDLVHFAVGLIFGSLLGSVGVLVLIKTDASTIGSRNECELNLPRTKQCVNVWIPQVEETK